MLPFISTFVPSSDTVRSYLRQSLKSLSPEAPEKRNILEKISLLCSVYLYGKMVHCFVRGKGFSFFATSVEAFVLHHGRVGLVHKELETNVATFKHHIDGLEKHLKEQEQHLREQEQHLTRLEEISKVSSAQMERRVDLSDRLDAQIKDMETRSKNYAKTWAAHEKEIKQAREALEEERKILGRKERGTVKSCSFFCGCSTKSPSSTLRLFFTCLLITYRL